MCLRVHTAPPEAPSLVPNTHVGWFTATQFQRIQHRLLDPWAPSPTWTHHIYIIKNNKINLLKVVKNIKRQFLEDTDPYTSN